MKIVPPLEQERDAALASVGVVARINLYPAIRIRLLDEVMVTSWEHKACRIFFKDGELRSEPIGA